MPEHSQRMCQFTLNSLPSYLIYNICDYLSGLDIINLSKTCKRLDKILSDELIWDTVVENFSAIHCSSLIGPVDEYTNSIDDLQDLSSREIFEIFIKYTSNYLQVITGNYNDEKSTRDDPEISQQSFLDYIMQINFQIINASLFNEFKYILIGSGLDRNEPGSLFNHMFDDRTNSFEPVGIIDSINNIGSGITVLMPDKAEICVLQDLYESLLEKINDPIRALHILANHIGLKITKSLKPGEENNLKSVYNLNGHRFGLIKLYSASAHANYEESSEYDRIFQSQLFDKSTETFSSQPHNLRKEDLLSSLIPNKNFRDVSANVSGLIFAIDARDSFDEISLLRYELDAVLKVFREPEKIPILLLYIFPKHLINVNKFLKMKEQMRGIEQDKAFIQDEDLDNNSSYRNSYIGRAYTKSWRSSLILPWDALQLTTLKNPWRLQKCSSNDIKSLVEGLIWFKNKTKTFISGRFNWKK